MLRVARTANVLDRSEYRKLGVERTGSRKVEQVERYARVPGWGPAAIGNAFDSEFIVLSAGGLSAAVDVFPQGRHKAQEKWASPATRDVLTGWAMLDPSAGVVGALLASGLEGVIYGCK